MIPSEETTELVERIHDLQEEVEMWRERAEKAEAFADRALEITYQARDLAKQSKWLLAHTISVVEEHVHA